MKYCVKCGNPMEDEMLFCRKCGAQCVIPANEANHSPQHNNYAKYWGLRYKDAESGNEIELTPAGVRIFHAKGIKKVRFDKTIPYNEIIDVNSERATTLKSGYLSIITSTEGITGSATRQQLLFDHNTVLFTKKTEPEAERIYRAIEDICSAPPASSNKTTLYESDQDMSSFSVSLSNPPKSKKRKGCLIPIVAVFVLLVAVIAISQSPTSSTQQGNTPSDTVKVICDVEQFANITGEELIALLGQPDDISEGTCTGAFEIPCVYYDYNNEETLGEVSFALVNNNVAKFTSYNNYSYAGKENVLACFGIEKSQNCVVAADTGTALRYRCPSEPVDDFWVNLIEDDTFGSLQVTYDMLYYDEWYLPTSTTEQASYQTKTETAVKSILKSPKTADFPLLDWFFGKNHFYFAVQSYVDAQNSFGAVVRSDFTFIYSTMTGELVYAVFDSEIVADNGYVPTKDLVQQIYDEMKQEATENTSTDSESSANLSNNDNPTKQSETTTSEQATSESTTTTNIQSENSGITVTSTPDTTNSEENYDDFYGEMNDVNAGLAYQDFLENLPTLDDAAEWETEANNSDLDGICTSLTDEELAALEAASGN